MNGYLRALGLMALLLLPTLAQSNTNGDPHKEVIDQAWQAYQNGDYAKAMEAFKILADEGIVQAQLNLGYMFALGEGTEPNLTESARWLRMAAEQGHVGAQTTLGVYYFNGEGVDQDFIAAHAWFSLATAAGHPQADDYKALVAKELTQDQLDRSHELAKKLYGRFGKRANLW